ncbi:MAG: transglutaminase family protein [Candidatus Bathyarchaeia archaeon]
MRSVTEGEEIEYYVKSTVTYSNRGDKPWNFTEREEDRAIGLFMNNSWQTVYLVTSTPPVETRENNTDGNPVAVLRFPDTLNPGRNISYSVTYRVISKPRTLDNINETASKNLSAIPPEFLKEKYLGAEGPWLINDIELQNLAYNITGNESNVLTIVNSFISWIKTHITYPDPNQMHEVPQYPDETLREQEGDCDDQAILLVTLCRILRIPAFLQIGAIYTPHLPPTKASYWDNHVTAVQKRIGWHGWAIVYIPPWGWLPVDLTYTFKPIAKDPLNAIKNAAVTSQITIQYMNISQSDYVASSREARDFLMNNGFYVYMEDEMTKITRRKKPFVENVENLLPVFLVAAALLLTSSYVRARRLKREEETPTDLTSVRRNI